MQSSDQLKNKNTAVAGILDHIADQFSSTENWQKRVEQALSLLGDALSGEMVVLVSHLNTWRVIRCTESINDLDELELQLYQRHLAASGGPRSILDNSDQSTSSISVPVIGAGEVLGVLYIRRNEPRTYVQKDVTIASVISSKIGAYLVEVARHIAENQQKREEAVENSCLSILYKQARDIILFVRSDGEIADANDAALRAYGYDRDEMLSLAIYDLRKDDTLELGAQMMAAEAEGITFETVHRRKDGTAFPVEVSSQGAVIGGESVMLSIIRDITERKRAEFELALAREEAIRRAEEMSALKIEAEMRAEEMARLRAEAELRAREAEEGKQILEALMEYVPDGIVIIDAANMSVRMISKSGLDMSEFAHDITEGMSLRDSSGLLELLHPDTLLAAKSEEMPLMRAIKKGEVIISEEWAIKRVDSEPLPILCSAGPIRDRAGRIIGAIATWREITEIEATQKGLEDAYEREHHIAEVLQQALIPVISRRMPGCAISACYEPAWSEAEVGGDFYDVFDLSDGRIAVLLGDVSGKGLKAAEFTAMVKYMVRAYAHEDPEPGHVLARLNNAMEHYVEEDKFATTIFGVLDTKQHTLTYANAGHDLPLLYSHEAGCTTKLEVTGRAVGVLGGASYDSRSLELAPGDVLLVYTDGITDAGSPGELFGLERLAKVLQSNSGKGEEHIISAVFTAAREFAGKPLHDDAAVLVLKATDNY